MPRCRTALLAAFVGVLALTGCSSSHPASSATTTTSTAVPTSTASTTPATTAPTAAPTTAPAPQIVSLTGPRSPVDCNAPTSIDISWETKDATLVTLEINGAGVFAKYSDGAHANVLVPLVCNGRSQNYQLTAHGVGGATATRTLTVTEHKSV